MRDLETRIVEATRELEGISALILFGSRAGGSPRPDSDLDIAVLPAADAPIPRRKLQARLAQVLADLAPGGRVDVVLLDEAPELLRQRVLELGAVLIQRDPKRWSELRVATMREHGDREPYRRLLREAQARRLAAGAEPR
jgi:predicted nucleotidyltransferase